MTCEHRRKKKNYSFGRKSKPVISCSDCHKVLNSKDRPRMRIKKVFKIKKKQIKEKMKKISHLILATFTFWMTYNWSMFVENTKIIFGGLR